jgi:general secretion pathway protein L
MKTLRVRLCPLAELGAEAELDFEVLDERRAVIQRGRSVPASLPRHGRTELVVAAPDVLLVEAALPPLSGARLRAALVSLAEPHVLGDIASAFVVASPGPRATLAVLDRALFARAVEFFRRLKMEPAGATPEQLSLPLADGRWRLRLGPTYGCLRTGPLRGMSTSPSVDSAVPVELQLALQQAGDARPAAIEVEGSAPLGWDVPMVAVEPALRAAPVVLELLQYELAPRLASVRAWRVPAALAAATLIAWLVGLNVDAWLMRREERVLRAHMDAALREALPGTPVVLDPVKQLRRAVADLRTGAGASDPREFLGLASTLARALPAEGDTVRVREFRDNTLRIDFDPKALQAKNAREAMVEKASAAGLTARFSEATLSVRAKGDGS